MAKFVRESWLVLLMGVTFTALLAGTQMSLKGQIQENKNKALNEAISEVVPALKSTEEIEVEGLRVFKCLDDGGMLAGWAVQASGGGFIDKITTVIGFNAACDSITGVKVIDQVETPGLGNKIAEAWWDDQYDGLSADPDKKLSVVNRERVESDNEIEAITGATWSSKYVTDIVNDVIEKILPKLEEHRQAPPDAGSGEGV